MKTKGKSTVLFVISVLVIAILAYVGILGLNVGEYRLKSFNETIKKGLDLQGGISILTEIQEAKPSTETINKSIELLNMRINPSGVSEITVSKEGDKKIRIEIPGKFNLKEVEDSVSQPGKLRFEGPDKVEILSGNDVTKASARADSTGKPVIDLEFNASGTKKFAEGTSKFIGQSISIYMDTTLVESATVQAVISDGKAQISGGNMTLDEAKSKATKINAGALPVTLKTISTKVVGASLGATAFPNSMKAAKVGIGLVLLFMLLYYRVPGLIADIALVLYSMMVLGVFSAVGATLTLSGIAGFLLTVGMAVDANVLIFERMKEELKSGKSIKSSIDAGFHRAMTSILDSNITTLIAAFCLYFLGSGPVKGFALTLIIGVSLSMFTAITVTKFLINTAANMGWFNKEWEIGTFGVHDVRRGSK